MQAIRPARGSHPPGAYWYYNNWDFNALGTIFDRATGEVSIYQAFKMRIADPIGIQDLAVQELRYTYQPDSMHPYYGFAMSARDLARFGLLFARRGRWGDRQIVPASWVLESTSPHSNAGALGGYGYLWWVAANKRHLPNVALPDGCFSMQGGPGQFVLVLPAWDIVIVHLVDSYLPTNEVSNCQFGSLARLILKASLQDVGLEIPKVGERIEIDEAELARFVGRYDGQTVPVPLSVEQNGGNLTAVMPPEGPFVLVPVTPTRFLIENWPGAHIEFAMDGNRVGTATIVLSGSHRLLFKPKQQA
jgi:CubicO group peptidase (beta-lactamase class C family)